MGQRTIVHDNAPYCVSIALRDKQSLLLGVVYEPAETSVFMLGKEEEPM